MATAYLRRDPLTAAWPGYPERCANGHEWGAWADHRELVDMRLRPSGGGLPGRPAGAPGVYCAASLGCRSVWYRPQLEPTGS